MGLQPLRSQDFWHHVKSGQYAWERGWPAREEPFSHTAAGKPWIQYEWLAQIALYQGYERLGVAALILLKAALVAAAFVLAAWACMMSGASPLVACLAAAQAGLIGSLRSYLRPEIFTALLFAVFVLVTAWVRGSARNVRNRKRAWLLSLIVLASASIFWVNVHGAYIAGLAYLGIVAAGETLRALFRREPGNGEGYEDEKRSRADFSGRKKRCVSPFFVAWRMWGLLAVCGIATLVNPYGPRIWLVPMRLSQSAQVRSVIAEWQRPDPACLVRPEFWGLSLLVVCVLITWRRFKVADLPALVVFGGLAFSARRHVWVFCLVNAPLFARHLGFVLAGVGKWLRRRRLSRVARVPGAGYGVALALMCWAALGIPTCRKFGLGVREQNYPVRAARFLSENRIAGNIFNTYGFGNYLMWALYPGVRVFIDGRVDVYGTEVVREYDLLRSAAAGWNERLKQRDVHTAVVKSRAGSGDGQDPIVNALWRDPDWDLVFWDGVGAVFMDRYPERLAEGVREAESRFLAENPWLYDWDESFSYERAGNIRAAIACMETVLRLNPDHGPSKKRLAALRERMDAGRASP